MHRFDVFCGRHGDRLYQLPESNDRLDKTDRNGLDLVQQLYADTKHCPHRMFRRSDYANGDRRKHMGQSVRIAAVVRARGSLCFRRGMPGMPRRHIFRRRRHYGMLVMFGYPGRKHTRRNIFFWQTIESL